MKLKLSFSTCPNDTFMFYALVHGVVKTDHIFDISLADIEELNRMAINGVPDITKLSYGTYPLVADTYQLLDSGSALGEGVGPLLVSKHSLEIDRTSEFSVALPGEHTTAHLLFNMAFPNVNRKSYYLFSEIEDAVLRGEVDAGVIIHESRFTYQQKGLIKLADLGEFWEKSSGLPTPLGGIAIRRSLDSQVKKEINSKLSESVRFALTNPHETIDYVAGYAQTMSPEVMFSHINLYVNSFSVTLGEKGRKAVAALLNTHRAGAKDFDECDIFIHD